MAQKVKRKGKGKGREMKSRGTVSFELEDFMECVHFKGNAAMLPSSSRNKEQPKEEKQRRLDLKLSL